MVSLRWLHRAGVKKYGYIFCYFVCFSAFVGFVIYPSCSAEIADKAKHRIETRFSSVEGNRKPPNLRGNKLQTIKCPDLSVKLVNNRGRLPERHNISALLDVSLEQLIEDQLRLVDEMGRHRGTTGIFGNPQKWRIFPWASKRRQIPYVTRSIQGWRVV